MSTKSPYFKFHEQDSLAQTLQDARDRKRNHQLAMGASNQRGVPESQVDNINGAIAMFNGVNKNVGLGFGKKKQINAI